MPVNAAAEASRVDPALVGRVGASPSPATGFMEMPPVAGVQLDDGGGVWGTPPPALARVTQEGILAYAKESLGRDYLAIPIGPGHLVEVCGPGGCWTAVSTDAGPDLGMQRDGRIADVAVGHWEDICGVPRAFGLCDGTWTLVDGPTVTLPPTDVEP